ncbi:MAG: alkaline phosphatase family protein [Candidatus Diapherotrites archaeon]|nr:alkaline phosphatase family protein [Candidatus Diapherotrites archaeon]
MIVILGMDALDYYLVKEFGLPYLQLEEYGKTDISGIGAAVTPIMWSSFLTGRDMFREVAGGRKKVFSYYKGFRKKYIEIEPGFVKKARKKVTGKIRPMEKIYDFKESWNIRVPAEKTFLGDFKSYKALSVPGFNQPREEKDYLHQMMKKFLKNEITEVEYKEATLEFHRKSKAGALKALKEKPDLLFWYTPVTDVWGHLFFSDKETMYALYKEMNDFARQILEEFDPELLLIVSDHGMQEMKSGGGEHLNLDYAFYACTPRLGLKDPSILDFRGIMKGIAAKGIKNKKRKIKAGEGREPKPQKKEVDKEKIVKSLQNLGYI